MRETIEEAAREFDKSKCKHFRREHTKEAVYDSFEEGFTAGAKSDAARDYWFEKFQEQGKNKYSEQDMKHAFFSGCQSERQIKPRVKCWEEFIEQFKKSKQ
jgi:hypothetical protein